MEPSIVRESSTPLYHNYGMTAFIYRKKMDQNRMEHLLETLHSVVKFGGQALGRVARNAQYRASLSAEFVKRVDNGESATFYLALSWG